MKHHELATANAAAATTAIVYGACRILIIFFPEAAYDIARSIFHGLEVSQSAWDLSINSFVVGIVSATITAWIIGYLFARLYNFFLKK